MADNNQDIDLHLCRYCNKYIVRLNNSVYCACGEAYHPSCAERCRTSTQGTYRCCTSRGGIANISLNSISLINNNNNNSNMLPNQNQCLDDDIELVDGESGNDSGVDGDEAYCSFIHS